MSDHEVSRAIDHHTPHRADIPVSIGPTAEGIVVAVLVVLGAVGLVFLIAIRPSPSAPAPTATQADEVYDPYWAGEEMPPGYRQLLGRDVIRPIYQPRYVPAAEARYQPDALIIGVTLGEEAHAYPVNELNRREMVNDWMHGTPILVTW